MSWDKTQQVGNNQTFKCFKQVMQRYGNLVSALAYQPLFLLVLLLAPNKNVAQEIDASKILPDGYNSQMRPGNPLEYKTLNVSISVYINDLLGAVDKDQTIQLDLIMVQQWHDTRLNVSVIGRNQNFIVTQPSIIQQFWLPDVYFVNGLSATVVNAFQAVQKLTITGDSLLSYAQRINALLSCPMNLQNFPHDYQYCRVKVSTMIYNKSEIILVWNDFEAYPSYYPIFKIRHMWTADCENWENPLPENSCIVGTLKLVRRLSYYIIRYYLLSFLTVAISLVNFWVPINAWPARITLLVMPLLNIISQDISINNDIGVFYVVSFHWWMMWLHGIVYMEIVEYAVAIAWAHFISDKKYYAKLLEQANRDEQSGNPATVQVPPYVKGYYFGNKGWYNKCGRVADSVLYFCFGEVDYQLDPYTRNKVDYMARIVYVSFFLSFTFLYVMITTIYWSANFY